MLFLAGACNRQVSVTVPRPVHALCPETPCRIPVHTVSGRIPKNTRIPHNILLDLQDFSRNHPQISPYRYKKSSGTVPGNLNLWVQTGTRATRHVVTASSFVDLDRMDFPGLVDPHVSTVQAIHPAWGTFFHVSWLPADQGEAVFAPESRKMNSHPDWSPLLVFIPRGPFFVLNRIPLEHTRFWLVLIRSLGPMAVLQPEPGMVTTAQMEGIPLFQWAGPVSLHWNPLRDALGEEGTVAVHVHERQFHAQRVASPVVFLARFLESGKLTREQVWEAWTALLQAGWPARDFEQLGILK